MGRRELGLSDISCVLNISKPVSVISFTGTTCLVGFMSRSRCDLAFLARRKFGEIAMVVSLPVVRLVYCDRKKKSTKGVHFVVENLGLSRFSLWDE